MMNIFSVKRYSHVACMHMTSHLARKQIHPKDSLSQTKIYICQVRLCKHQGKQNDI